MSVEYKSVLIHGFECNPDKFSSEEREFLEDIGWDVIQDGYDDKFLYVGKIISSTGYSDEVKVDCLRELAGAISDTTDLMNETPNMVFKKFPCDASMYHLCYAT